MIIIWILFEIAEVVRHWFIIKFKKKSPNKVISFCLRGLIASAILYFDTTPLSIAIQAYVIAGWYIHDYLLNLFLGKKFYYLNETGFLDKLQRRIIGQDVWFFWKSIWLIGGLGIYFTI
jgi:hypothetical protein